MHKFTHLLNSYLVYTSTMCSYDDSAILDFRALRIAESSYWPNVNPMFVLECTILTKRDMFNHIIHF